MTKRKQIASLLSFPCLESGLDVNSNTVCSKTSQSNWINSLQSKSETSHDLVETSFNNTNASPVHLALLRRDLTALNILLRFRPNLEATCGLMRVTALHLASVMGWMEGVQALIKAGSDLNALARTGRSAAYFATVFGYYHLATLFAESFASFSGVDLMTTPLFRGYSDLIRALLYTPYFPNVALVSGRAQK